MGSELIAIIFCIFFMMAWVHVFGFQNTSFVRRDVRYLEKKTEEQRIKTRDLESAIINIQYEIKSLKKE